MNRTPLPPGLVKRGQYLLTGRIKPQDAEPGALAYATNHILTNRSLEADAFRRPRVSIILAELRQSLGTAPWSHFGPAALQSVAAAPGGTCRRCRANMIAKVQRIPPPPRDDASMWLLGQCPNCRPSPTPARASATGSAQRASEISLRPADARALPSDRTINALYASAGDALRELFVQDMTHLGKYVAADRLAARLAGVR